MTSTPEIFGKHFIVGLEGITLSEEEKSYLNFIKPSGIILFARNFAPNISWRDDLNELISSAKNSSNNSIKFVSIDFEGGRVNRFPDDIKKFPYAQEWCDNSYEIGKEMATILKELGINLTYGPVADIDLNQNNPVIGKRAFSNNKMTVTKSCKDFIRANEELGILCCAKHFPGHGRTCLDSHVELPLVNCSLNEINQDIYPFAELIKSNIKIIMTSHVVFECLDPCLPASLSKIIQTDLLREKLGFDGIIVSDDLDMKALKSYSETEKAKMALSAGTDLLLFGNGIDSKALQTAASVIEELIALEINTELTNLLAQSKIRIDNI